MNHGYFSTQMRNFILAFALFLLSTNSFSQIEQFKKLIYTQTQQKVKPDYSMAISGNTAIVGMFLEGTSTHPQTGIAYIFERNKKGTWETAQKLESSSKSAFDNFGISVAISGNYAVIGSLGHDPVDSTGNKLEDAGAAFFYERKDDGTWTEVQMVTASDIKPYHIFGTTVAITGQNAIISSHKDGSNGVPNKFSNWQSYVFERNSNGLWLETKKLNSSSKSDNKNFGLSTK